MPLAATVPAALDALVEALQSAGVAATRDPATFQPPGVIVAAPTMRDATLGGAIALGVPVYCVTADPGQPGLDELLDMVDAVRGVFGVFPAAPDRWAGPLNPAGLPAYRIDLDATAEAIADPPPTTRSED